MSDAHQVPTLPKFRKCSAPGSSDPVVVNCCHTSLDKNKPSIVIALPFGVPVEVTRAAFTRFKRKFNVVTWESRYILNLDVAFSGTESLSPAEHVGDMIGVLRALEIDRCCLIGYCSGGGIALLAAKHHPDRFTDLILVNGEYQLFRRGHASTVYQRSIDTVLPLVATSRKEARSLVSTMAEGVRTSKGEEPSELHKQMNLPFSGEEYLFRYAKNYMAYRDFDALDIASEIQQTTFVVAGQLDEHTNMENSQAIADHIPRSTTFIDEEGDHYAFCHSGSRTLEAIGRHLEV